MGMAQESCYKDNGVSFIDSGDQGNLDQQGRLYVLGRYEGLIIRAGDNVAPARIERHLDQMHSLKACLLTVLRICPLSRRGRVLIKV